MKKILFSLVAFSAVSASAVMTGQTVQLEMNLPVEQKLEQFEARLGHVDRDHYDRNSRLRLQRAEHYYNSALKFHHAKWDRQAIDYVRRGEKLLDLRSADLNQNTTSTNNGA